MTGKIVKADGSPAAGACVTIQTASSCAAVADAQGSYRVELLASSVANVTWNFRYFFNNKETVPGLAVNNLPGGQTKVLPSFTVQQ